MLNIYTNKFLERPVYLSRFSCRYKMDNLLSEQTSLNEYKFKRLAMATQICRLVLRRRMNVYWCSIGNEIDTSVLKSWGI